MCPGAAADPPPWRPSASPEFDNATLGHRPIAHHRGIGPAVTSRDWRLVPSTGSSASWTTKQEAGRMVLEVEPFERLSKTAKDELVAEGTDLLRFMGEGARDGIVSVRR